MGLEPLDKANTSEMRTQKKKKNQRNPIVHKQRTNGPQMDEMEARKKG
jgi:hypothetical protein